MSLASNEDNVAQRPNKNSLSGTVSKSGHGRNMMMLGSSSKHNASGAIPLHPTADADSQHQAQHTTRSNSVASNSHSIRANQSKPKSRFSLRRLFYTNPLFSPPFTRTNEKDKQKKCERDNPSIGSNRVKETLDTQSEGSWRTGDNYSTSSSVAGVAGASGYSSCVIDPNSVRECPLCLEDTLGSEFPQLRNCPHLSCIVCLKQYVKIEIQEGRINLKCPQCSESLHPNDIEMLVAGDSGLLNLYESLMLRRVLATDPDTRWCPAPNCTFAVVATGCASCPKINCEREGCYISFCYHCKQEWHPNQTCDKARAQRQPVRSSSISFTISGESGSGGVGVLGGLALKQCPRCSVLVEKVDDDRCNHMTCAICGAEFCWLCMKEISDLHYLTISGKSNMKYKHVLLKCSFQHVSIAL